MDFLYRPLFVWSGRLLGRLLRLDVRWVEGQDELPEGGFVLVSGHFSFLDPLPLAVALAPRKLRFMGTATFFKLPVGRLYPLIGAFPVRRGKGDKSALVRAANLAKAGQVVVVFPEGTRRSKGKWLAKAEHHQARPRRGAARIALAAGVPVVPVGLQGLEGRLPGRWRVLIGAPISSAGKTPAELTDELWEAVSRLERMPRGG